MHTRRFMLGTAVVEVSLPGCAENAVPCQHLCIDLSSVTGSGVRGALWPWGSQELAGAE